MSVFIINAVGFAAASFFWKRDGIVNVCLGLCMAFLAVLNAGLAGSAWGIAP